MRNFRNVFTTADLIKVLATEPDLTSHGIGICRITRYRDPLELAQRTYEARAELFNRVGVIAKVVEWLRPYPKLKHAYRWSHSYHWKHVCEREIGQYVSNGELLVAAIHLGFKYEADGVNANTNIGKIKKPLCLELEECAWTD